MNSSWQPLLHGPDAERVLQVVREIAAELPAADVASPFRNASLAGGQTGKALFFAYLALHTGDEAAADLAAELLDNASEQLAETPLPPTLYTGFPGVAWTLEHLQGRLFEPADDGEDPAIEIDEALIPPLERTPWRGEYDLISGLTGVGIYALERLPRPSAAAVLSRVVDRLAETAEALEEGGRAWFTPPEQLPEWQREYHPRGNYNLGVAHGLPGVLPVLAGACAAGVNVEKARPLLDANIRFLLARRLGPDEKSCYSHTYAPWETPTASRLAWCYGDPGIAASLLAAARAVGEKDWEREALEVGLRSAACPESKSGINDAGLCHGAAGLGHLFNRMYQTTGDERFAEAARFWIERAINYREDGQGIAGFRSWGTTSEGKMDWRTEPGFLEGVAGIGLGLLGAISEVEPAWDRILAISVKTPKGD